MTTTEPLPEQSNAGSHRSRWVALIAVAVAVVAIGAIIATVVVIGGDEPATAAPLSQVKASCTNWMDSASDAKPDDQWCTDMFAWMGDHSAGSMMSDSDNSMMGNMMWQGSEQMGEACRAWVSDEQGETGGTGLQQCDAMLEWMDGHMSSKGGHWMMQNR